MRSCDCIEGLLRGARRFYQLGTFVPCTAKSESEHGKAETRKRRSENAGGVVQKGSARLEHQESGGNECGTEAERSHTVF